MHAKTLIALAVQRSLRKSMRALAEQMGVTVATLSEWNTGKRPIPDERIQQLAKLAGQEPGPWLLLIHSEQDGGELGRTWAALAKQLGAVTMAVMLVVGMAFPALAGSKAANITPTVYTLCEMAHRRISWVWLWISSHLPSRPRKNRGEIAA